MRRALKRLVRLALFSDGYRVVRGPFGGIGLRGLDNKRGEVGVAWVLGIWTTGLPRNGVIFIQDSGTCLLIL